MRILFVSSSKYTHEGSSKALMNLLNELVPFGVQPMIVLPRKDSLYTYLVGKGIKCIVLSQPYRMSVYPISQSIKEKLLFIPRLICKMIINSLATIQLLKIIKDFRPNIIHSNDSGTAIGYYAARFLNLPHIRHIREYGALNLHPYAYYPSFSHQKKRYKRKKSYTICITKDIQHYNSLFQHPTSRVIYDGVLPSNSVFYSKLKKSYLLYAGRLETIKGILPLIDAYAVYKSKTTSPLPLYIAGSGTDEYTQLVKNKIVQFELTDNITLLGMRNDILSFYKEAKAFIVPSLSEGFGFITTEAMFSGCLVIGNNIAGTKEQFDNGKELTGEEIALRYNNQEELVQHLIDITEKKIAFYEPMILRGQRVVEQLYSTEKSAKQILDFYNYILEQETTLSV